MPGALGRSEERSGLKKLIVGNFFERPLPKNLSWFRCLGGLALVTFLIQVGTGIFLVSFYVPSVAVAFSSVQHIRHEVLYGWLISKLHLVGAQIMIGCIIAHLLRVLFKGAYNRPRELHWISGTFLLIFTLLMGYTGSKLPVGDVCTWNVDVGGTKPSVQAYVSPTDTSPTTVVKYKVGAPSVGTDTSAKRFPLVYAVHVAVVPIIICSFMGLHFLMIRRTGISEPL